MSYVILFAVCLGDCQMGMGGGRGDSERAEGREFSFLGTVSRLTPDPAGDFDKLFASKAPSVGQRETCKSPIIFWGRGQSGVCAGSPQAVNPSLRGNSGEPQCIRSLHLQLPEQWLEAAGAYFPLGTDLGLGP